MRQRNLFPKDGLPARLRGDFDAFWRAYPPRSPNPRKLAEAAFLRAVVAGVAPSDLVAAATAYAAEVKRKAVAEDYIVHARTFLAQQRFLDYLTPAAPEPMREIAIDHPLWLAMKNRIGTTDFRRWIEPLVVVSHREGDAALLQAPTRFHRDWVRQHYDLVLKASLGVRILDVDIAEDIRP